MQGDRQVGGLWCHEVLSKLSDYLDDELKTSEREQVEEHLRDCDTCERFGGEFASAIKTLREDLANPAPLDSELERRLQERLLATDS
jgi:anti-sigma factor RsiW